MKILDNNKMKILYKNRMKILNKEDAYHYTHMHMFKPTRTQQTISDQGMNGTCTEPTHT